MSHGVQRKSPAHVHQAIDFIKDLYIDFQRRIACFSFAWWKHAWRKLVKKSAVASSNVDQFCVVVFVVVVVVLIGSGNAAAVIVVTCTCVCVCVCVCLVNLLTKNLLSRVCSVSTLLLLVSADRCLCV